MFNYDEFSRLSTVTFPAGQGSAGYQYNGQDVPVQVTDPRGLVTAYDADGFGQVGGLTSPDTGSTQNTYDEAGNLTKRVLAGGQTVSFSYDAVDRITSVSASDFSAGFEYDAGAVGQLTGMTDEAGRTDWTYDTKGRVATKTQTIDGRTWAVGYGWQGDTLTQLTYPSGRVVSFALDHGRITSISVDGQAALTGVTYLAMGGVSGWSMGAAGNYNYIRNFDVHGRVTGYTGPDGQRTLTLDDDNRVTAIKETSGAVIGSYGYDSMGRLVSAVDGGITRSYAYDLNGNRTQLSVGGANYSVDISTSSNQISFASLPNAGAGSFDHDANGNLTSNGRATLQWNSLGYATSAASSSGSVDFSYNGFGQRVRKVSGATGTRYYVYAEDNQTLLGEYDAAGQPVAEYVYLEGLPALVLKPSGMYFVLADHLGTPRGIKNGQGAVVWRWDADAFGNGVPNDDVAGVGAFESNLRFPGQVFDRETGLHYNNARYYDPAVGRYVSSDPIGLEGGLNTYSYVNGQPTALSDPSGNIAFVLIPLAAPTASFAVNTAAWVALVATGATAAYHTIPAVKSGVKAAATVVPRGPQIFVTYERQNPATGQYYCGRTSGYGNPDDIARRVLLTPRHWVLTGEGFNPVQGAEKSSLNKPAIRGREQQLIDFRGGAQSVGGSARNLINGIADKNPRRPLYMGQAAVEFGTLPDNSPLRPRK